MKIGELEVAGLAGNAPSEQSLGVRYRLINVYHLLPGVEKQVFLIEVLQRVD